MDEDEPFPGEPRQGRDGVGLGILIGIGLELVCGPMLAMISNAISSEAWAVAAVAIGVTQLVYMAPAALVARAKGRPGIMKGILIVAAVVFLLNAGCFGLLALDGFGLH